VSAETKPDTSPVTVADKEKELIVRDAIEKQFPDDGVLGEEGSSTDGCNRRRVSSWE
jgi:fructose-1,6-bisphosphatase/inositol monophosphatase family enzyme